MVISEYLQDPTGSPFIFAPKAWQASSMILKLKVLLNFGTKIDFICDNNFNYFGKKLYKRIVKNPKILEKKLYKFSNYKLLICNNEKSQFNIIKKQLTKMGIKNRNIIHASL